MTPSSINKIWKYDDDHHDEKLMKISWGREWWFLYRKNRSAGPWLAYRRFSLGSGGVWIDGRRERERERERETARGDTRSIHPTLPRFVLLHNECCHRHPTHHQNSESRGARLILGVIQGHFHSWLPNHHSFILGWWCLSRFNHIQIMVHDVPPILTLAVTATAVRKKLTVSSFISSKSSGGETGSPSRTQWKEDFPLHKKSLLSSSSDHLLHPITTKMKPIMRILDPLPSSLSAFFSLYPRVRGREWNRSCSLSSWEDSTASSLTSSWWGWKWLFFTKVQWEGPHRPGIIIVINNKQAFAAFADMSADNCPPPPRHYDEPDSHDDHH